jgi:hypothetical protein
VRSKSGNVSFKLKEGHIVLKVGDEKLPKGITPKNPAASKDVTVVFVN